MIYLYTIPGCPVCERRKRELLAEDVPYIERSLFRLVPGAADYDRSEWDMIDVSAAAQAAMQNYAAPVEVKSPTAAKSERRP